MTEAPWSVGERLQTYEVPEISRHQLVEVMAVMHDTNPIHCDEELAAELGFRGLVNQGPANLAYVVQMLRGAVAGGVIQDLRFRFHDNVVPGDALRVTGEISRIMATPTSHILTCDFRLESRPEDHESGIVGEINVPAPVRVSGVAVLEVEHDDR